MASKDVNAAIRKAAQETRKANKIEMAKKSTAPAKAGTVNNTSKADKTPSKTSKKSTSTAKKTSAKKTTAKPAEPGKIDIHVQYMGHDLLCKDVLKKALRQYEKTATKKAKKMDIYIKPEDSMAYITIDGEEIGQLKLF